MLRENGRMAVVLPESIFDTTENKYIRLFIYKFFEIKAIVSLPQSTFAPYTNTKTSILFAKKRTKKEVEKWNKLWEKHSKEWKRLRTRTNNIIDVYYDRKTKNELPSIKNLSESEELFILFDMLGNLLRNEELEAGKKILNEDEESVKTYKSKIIEKYESDLVSFCRINNDTKDSFGRVNTWWVFSKVAEELNYEIFMAEADEVGYKRTARGERTALNDLFRIDNDGEIIIDDGKMETVLDYIREIDWSK